MALDIVLTIEILKDALLRDLGDEVDLIFRYGSHLKGTAHQYSDIDISFVPIHESTRHNITVLVDDTMIDFYPIHWSQLERMANFENISSTVLLDSQIVYQRNEAVAERFRSLAARLRELQQPEAHRMMLKKAQDIFQNTGYQYYLLRQQALSGHRLSCMQHSRNILKGVLHCLTVCNQSAIDTRKLEQVLALPKLPDRFAETVDCLTKATEPDGLLAACETLLNTTRTLLLNEQQAVQRSETTFPAVFRAGYPELKGDLQHLMLACERHDLFNFNFMSLYHELMIHMAQAFTGVEYSGFNSLAEYEQDLIALGFPDLLAYVVAGDYEGLHQQCRVFDERLQQFLTEHSVELNTFTTLDELQAYLNKPTS